MGMQGATKFNIQKYPNIQLLKSVKNTTFFIFHFSFFAELSYERMKRNKLGATFLIHISLPFVGTVVCNNQEF